MVNNTNEILGFNRVLELIAGNALSESAKERICGIIPFVNIDDVFQRMNRITALQALMEKGEQIPLRYFKDIRSDLYRCRVEGSYLFAETLLHILGILQQSVQLRQFIRKNRESLKPLNDLMDSLNPLEKEIGKIRRIVDDNGDIRDSASGDLGRIRKQIQQTVARLHREIDRVMDRARQENWLHEENPTIRDGRFVLPLRSESKRKIKGIIHGQSATGATSYVEPLILVEINNTLKELEIVEQDEIERILKRITDELRLGFQDIMGNIDILTELDFLNACAGFSRRFNCTVPAVTPDRRQLVLINARHPLLSLVKEVIPLNVSIDEVIRCVIITGPNAGGKTVAMKTIGLLGLMVSCGLPVPVDEGSKVPYFDLILMDIGDRQSIEDDLSTFTSHVSNLKKIVETATDRSLVLIDELGTGTDPLEGSALGRAVLEKLVRRKAFTTVTTHHSGLKAYADQDPNVMNAAMEFDLDLLQPTYRFQAGLPGSSYALEISKRMGLDDSVIDRARDLMGADQVKLEHLLIEVDTLKTRIEKENKFVERNKKTLDKLIAEYDKKLTSIREKHESMDDKIAVELERLVNESRSKIEHAVKNIREKDASRETIIEAKKTLETVHQTARKRQHMKKTPQADTKSGFSVGDSVRVEGISGTGQVSDVQTDKRRAAVNINGKTIWISLDSLEQVKITRRNELNSTTVSSQVQSIPSYRLDLRGKRFEQAREELERFLDRALLAGLSQIQIIHGKGTGALQKMSHEVLKNTPGIRKFYFEHVEQGGTGVTIAEL